MAENSWVSEVIIPYKWSYFTLLITGFWAQLVMACNVMPLNPRGGWRGTPSVGMVARYPTEMVLLMEEIRLTSWYGKYPIIYKVLCIPGDARRISSINSSHLPTNFEQSGSCHDSFLLLPMPNADFSTFQPQTTQNVCMCHGVSKSLVNPTFEVNFITVSILIHILWWFLMGKLQRWVEWPITKWPTFLGKMNSEYISPSPTNRVATSESTDETHLFL